MVRRPSSSSGRRNGYHQNGSDEPEVLCDYEEEDDLRREVIPEKRDKRVILLLDLDCYEEQVWVKELRPDLEGKDVPIVVVNLDKIILAVNYTARQRGVKRAMGRRHLEEMQALNKDLVVITTGKRHGKQDSYTPQKYSDEIFQVLLNFQKTLKDKNSITIERSSKDEVYIDVTQLVKQRTRAARSYLEAFGLRLPPVERIEEMTSAVKKHPNKSHYGKPKVVMEGRKAVIHGDTLSYRIRQVYPQRREAYHSDEVRLVHGAAIAYTLTRQIREQTGFVASCGVAHNKLLAKLACGRNKPDGIGIITDISISRVSKTLKFDDVPGYGGTKGELLQGYLEGRGYKASSMFDILSVPFETLVDGMNEIKSDTPESDALDLMTTCRGQDDTTVEKRHFNDKLTTSWSFKGFHTVKTWKAFCWCVHNLARDMTEKIQYSVDRWNREPQSLIVKVTMRKRADHGPSGDAAANNKLRVGQDTTDEDISHFMFQYIKENRLNFRDIELLKLTAASFRFV